MCDDIYYYRDQVKELTYTTDFIRQNTLRTVIHKLEWLKDSRDAVGSHTYEIKMCIDIIRGMLE